MLEHQCGGNAEQDERDDQMAQAPSALRRFLAQITHHHEHDRELGQLRRLEMKEAEIDPSARSAGGVARDHHGDQQSDHHHIKRIRVGLQRAIVDEHRDQQRGGAGGDPDQLANHQRIDSLMPAVRRADDADQPDARQREHQDEQRPVEMKYVPAIAGRHQRRTPVIASLSSSTRAIFGCRRRRIELEVALEDVVNHGRRRAAAMTAVLDDAGGGDGRMILGRERDEPCVVLVLVGRILVFFLLALADRPCRRRPAPCRFCRIR